MKVGGKAMFWLPPNIGYPGTPRGNPETLAYAVELVDVVWSPATPPDVAKAPADATRTKSGLRWKKVKSASGDKPRAWDVVHLAYTGWDATGKIIDSSEVYGKPVTAPLDRLPPVFGEVLPQLAAGERARMWFPAETLGPRRPGMPEGDLCFEVSLTEITRRAEPPKAPATVAKPPADAKKTPKGVSYQVLATDPSLPGAGTKPAATDRVTVNYSGWTTDGKLFDSSIPDGTPRTFSVNGVIAGWTDALLMMSVGDTWRVWIPEELAYKGAPNKPQGMLVFDVQLLGINQPPPTPAHGAP
ncbi:MAG: FKBP-type peptidyl-prolyl cis-trans isomerase [Kofleriaceae bacterium]|nr:FKBP-type peptidyl-prolyl cis-trans isomerase [Myxococcales bacterium]MCB9560608.1 FKBP-type peptidyl-prolyl cis-trans isomerase [Kofleriaceae bacterium]